MSEQMQGSLEVHIGPMFSDKSSTLINAFARLTDQRSQPICLKPALDDRYGANAAIHAHNGRSAPAILFEHQRPELIFEVIPPGTTHALIDEIQFCSGELVGVLEQLLARGVSVVAAGLDLDFAGNPFGSTPDVVELAHRLQEPSSVHHHTATCDGCGRQATLSYAKVPMDQIVRVGAAEAFGAACPSCHPQLNQG